MCEYCEKGKNILTIEGELAVYINSQNKVKVITRYGEFGEEINYCPICRKKVRRGEIISVKYNCSNSKELRHWKR